MLKRFVEWLGNLFEDDDANRRIYRLSLSEEMDRTARAQAVLEKISLAGLLYRAMAYYLYVQKQLRKNPNWKVAFIDEKDNIVREVGYPTEPD